MFRKRSAPPDMSRQLLGLFLGSAIRIQNGIADGIELAVQNNNILHLTAEMMPDASHINSDSDCRACSIMCLEAEQKACHH
ncbi:MAG: hypothetical protein ACLS6O_07070 [Bifidobacterium sp.]